MVPWHYPKYALARSLLSQSVDKTETGRTFSSLALVSVLVPIFSKPLFAFIYDQSLQTFAGLFMVVTGLFIVSAMTIMIVLKFLLRSGSDKSDSVELSRLNE